MTVRLAVVGAGIMGANHARVARSARDVELVAVVDSDVERARAAAAPAEARVFGGLDELIAADVADAVVLAVPTPLHHGLTISALEGGLHVLVEKPIAGSLDDATEMIAAAASADRRLMVGHVERFNPVVSELFRQLDQPLHIEAQRVGPFSSRVKDSVVLDLMIHDLDIVSAIAGAPVSSVSGVGRRVKSNEIDLATVHLAFDNGVTATLTASRLGQQKIRQLAITQAETYVLADLVRQDISVNRVAHVEFLAEGGTRYRQTGVVEIPFLENRGEPLALEQEEFARSIAEGDAPLVDGMAGRAALELVGSVLDVLRVS